MRLCLTQDPISCTTTPHNLLSGHRTSRHLRFPLTVNDNADTTAVEVARGKQANPLKLPGPKSMAWVAVSGELVVANQ